MPLEEWRNPADRILNDAVFRARLSPGPDWYWQGIWEKGKKLGWGEGGSSLDVDVACKIDQAEGNICVLELDGWCYLFQRWKRTVANA